jgi:deoxyribonuclease V
MSDRAGDAQSGAEESARDGGPSSDGRLQHRWDLTVPEAVALQQELRSRVVRVNGFQPDQLRRILGVDASYSAYQAEGRAALVLCSFPEIAVLEQAVSARQSVFPYVPGLLSFREVPLVLDAFARLREQPDLLLVDGHGYAHPRRFGIASHLGVYLDLPSIGCAKSRLVGSYEEPGPEPGDRSPLTHRGEVIGMVLRAKRRTNPLFISVGHKVDLDTAVDIVLRCLRGYRLPEPTRLADWLAGVANNPL